MQNYEKTNDKQRRKIFGKAIIIFFSTMLLITFFSRTIQNMFLPRVIFFKPHSGILVYETTGIGTIIPRETLKIYPESIKKVKKIRVRAGDSVKKGQIIGVLTSKSLDRELTEEKIQLKILKKKLEKQLLNTKDNQIEILQLDVEKALKKKDKLQNELKKNKKLLQAGAKTIKQIKEAEYNLEIAQKDYEQKKVELEKAKKNHFNFLKENEKEIEILRYKLELQQLKINQLKEKILISPFEGIVKKIYYQKGELIPENQAFCSIINLKKGFVFSVSLKQEKKNFISIGDTISIILKSRNKTIDRPIERIIVKDNNIELITLINETDFQGGEKFEYRITKKSRLFNTIIPNNALGRDNHGYFVYVIKKQNGALGKEYYVKKRYITTGDSDNQNTVVLNGLDNRTSIVYSFEKVINDGSRVWSQQRE